MSDANLTEREVEVIRLRDEEKLTWAKIAERLSTAKGSVNASYRQAMAKIDRAENPEIQNFLAVIVLNILWPL